MASNLQLSSGSPLIGSPILYKVTAGSPGSSVETTFQRVKMYVYAGLSTADETAWHEFLFSRPVSKGETVEIDISSALTAVADKYQYTVEPPSRYPYIGFRLKACDEWMINGEVSGDIGIVENTGGRALMGRFSDLERLKAGEAGRTTTLFSRKPSYRVTGAPEIVCKGDTYLQYGRMEVSIGNIEHGPQCQQFTVASEGVNAGTVLLYALPENTRDRYQMRFVNGLGVVESISVVSLMTSEVNYQTDEYTYARPERFGSVSRNLITKQNDQERWHLSSGPIDRAWQQWYLHELLMTETAWILIDGTWIPCHIVPEETVSGIDRVKPSMLEVQFTVRFDIAGSPFASMLV